MIWPDFIVPEILENLPFVKKKVSGPDGRSPLSDPDFRLTIMEIQVPLNMICSDNRNLFILYLLKIDVRHFVIAAAFSSLLRLIGFLIRITLRAGL